jgi:hypothetical protein
MLRSKLSCCSKRSQIGGNRTDNSSLVITKESTGEGRELGVCITKEYFTKSPLLSCLEGDSGISGGGG